jgi:hypothetical protein
MAGVENFRAASAEECEKIEMGDRVRSYDFEFHDDCYVEGTITGIGLVLEGCPRYTISADRKCWGGEIEALRPERNIYPPVNGTRNLMGGYTNGVRRIHTADEWREILQDHAEDLRGDF